MTSSEVLASEFTSISFALSTDKLMQYLVTLTDKCSDGLYRCLIGLWNKQRLITCQTIKIEGDSIPLSVSFNPEDPKIVLITGKNVYRYMKLNAS